MLQAQYLILCVCLLLHEAALALFTGNNLFSSLAVCKVSHCCAIILRDLNVLQHLALRPSLGEFDSCVGTCHEPLHVEAHTNELVCSRHLNHRKNQN